MAGLNGLKKKVEISPEEQLAEVFISGAEKRVRALETKEKKFVRCTFSLNDEVNQLIDDLIVKSQNARVNRSSIVRIALENLASKSSEEIKEIVNQQIL
ncbi:hypothetical protein NI470_14740 [Acinetobacter lwoffii]|jgi:hypothetical protein|uniref:hypothetical protein n=1 Tax=Acinetobacter lwoffii TaxID=28090 RepID=UPI00209ADC97|nr:hypothetical protein [Acinetobacter lwoffii]MCO8074909.1 hypothetical protein [Acinetobacter lwoffii]MCO8077807.1 hypothetical protein [Acinetobacter lwoffii]